MEWFHPYSRAALHSAHHNKCKSVCMNLWHPAMHKAGDSGCYTPLLLMKQFSSVPTGSSLENRELKTHGISISIIMADWRPSDLFMAFVCFKYFNKTNLTILRFNFLAWDCMFAHDFGDYTSEALIVLLGLEDHSEDLKTVWSTCLLSKWGSDTAFHTDVWESCRVLSWEVVGRGQSDMIANKAWVEAAHLGDESGVEV